MMFLVIFCCNLLSGVIFAVIPIPSVAIALNVTIQFIILILQAGVLYIGIKRAMDEPITYKMIFRQFTVKCVLRLIGLFLLEFLIIGVVFLPAILLANFVDNSASDNIAIVISSLVALYLSTRITLALGLVVDKNMQPTTAIAQSFKATRNNVLSLLILFFAMILIMAASILTLGIAFIWTFPLGFILYGVIYKKLIVNLG